MGSWVQLSPTWPHWTNLFFSFALINSDHPLFSGDVESAVEVLEEVFTRPDSTSPSMSFVFRKILEEENDKALDKRKTLAHTMCIDRNTKKGQECNKEAINPWRNKQNDKMWMFSCSECYGRAASQPFCLLQTSFRPLPPAAGYGQSRGRKVHAGCEYECVCCQCECGLALCPFILTVTSQELILRPPPPKKNTFLAIIHEFIR